MPWARSHHSAAKRDAVTMAGGRTGFFERMSRAKALSSPLPQNAMHCSRDTREWNNSGNSTPLLRALDKCPGGVQARPLLLRRGSKDRIDSGLLTVPKSFLTVSGGRVATSLRRWVFLARPVGQRTGGPLVASAEPSYGLIAA